MEHYFVVRDNYKLIGKVIGEIGDWLPFDLTKGSDLLRIEVYPYSYQEFLNIKY